LELSADEINTLISRAPALTANQVHIFVVIANDEAQVQFSLPTNLIPIPLVGLKDRYVNGECAFDPGFDPDSKTLTVNFHRIRLGHEDMPQQSLSGIESSFDSGLNTQLQNSPDMKEFLDHAKTVTIRDGKLVIETD
jgi:hypothetical protein